MATAHEDAFFDRIRSASRSPEDAAKRIRDMAETVRGTAIETWPTAWSKDELLAVAMSLPLPVDELIAGLRKLWPGSFGSA